jgi:hypothetical protein
MAQGLTQELVLRVSIKVRLGSKETCSYLLPPSFSLQLEFGNFLVCKYISFFLTPMCLIFLTVSYYVYYFYDAGDQIQGLAVLEKHSTTELHLQPLVLLRQGLTL